MTNPIIGVAFRQLALRFPTRFVSPIAEEIGVLGRLAAEQGVDPSLRLEFVAAEEQLTQLMAGRMQFARGANGVVARRQGINRFIETSVALVDDLVERKDRVVAQQLRATSFALNSAFLEWDAALVVGAHRTFDFFFDAEDWSWLTVGSLPLGYRTSFQDVPSQVSPKFLWNVLNKILETSVILMRRALKDKSRHRLDALRQTDRNEKVIQEMALVIEDNDVRKNLPRLLQVEEDAPFTAEEICVLDEIYIFDGTSLKALKEFLSSLVARFRELSSWMERSLEERAVSDEEYRDYLRQGFQKTAHHEWDGLSLPVFRPSLHFSHERREALCQRIIGFNRDIEKRLKENHFHQATFKRIREAIFALKIALMSYRVAFEMDDRETETLEDQYSFLRVLTRYDRLRDLVLMKRSDLGWCRGMMRFSSSAHS